MLYDFIGVAGIKLAAGNFEYIGVSSKDVLTESILWLTDRYEKTKKQEYLLKTIWHIYAFKELGFSFQDTNSNIFKILDYVEPGYEEEITRIKEFRKRLVLNKTNIRDIIGRWNPKLHSMKINDVINDIYYKSSHQKYGEYEYHSGKVLASSHNKELYEKTFRLCIKKDEVILQDVCKNQYYELIGKVQDEKNSNS